MNLKIRIEYSRNSLEKEQDIKLLKEILRRNGISMFETDTLAGELTYVLKGNEQRIHQKMSRSAGAKPKTNRLKIQTILEIEEKYKGMPKEKEKALAEVGLKLRNYQLIKKDICTCYGTLQQAIEQGYRYFVRTQKTK